MEVEHSDLANDAMPVTKPPRSLVATVVSACYGCALIATGAYRLLAESEPLDAFDIYVAIVVVLGVIPVAALLLFGRNRRERVLAVLPFVGVVALISALATAEDVHWRWSRDDFARVARGETVRCHSSADCRVGWWRSRGEERWDSMVIVWIPDDACTGGLVWPLQAGMKADGITSALAERPEWGNPRVESWKDGWYTVCFMS